MAMVPTCDRCKTPGVQVVLVLGKDICNGCLEDVRLFLEVPPLSRGKTKTAARVDAALRICRLRGSVRDVEIAQLNGEPVRNAYYRLMGLRRAGKLLHLGKGVFVLARAEAAE